MIPSVAKIEWQNKLKSTISFAAKKKIYITNIHTETISDFDINSSFSAFRPFKMAITKAAMLVPAKKKN